MSYASGLLAADISGFEQYLETLSPVAFAFLTVELADSIMDLQHVVQGKAPGESDLTRTQGQDDSALARQAPTPVYPYRRLKPGLWIYPSAFSLYV
jgi:hypothetical protein